MPDILQKLPDSSTERKRLGEILNEAKRESPDYSSQGRGYLSYVDRNWCVFAIKNAGEFDAATPPIAITVNHSKFAWWEDVDVRFEAASGHFHFTDSSNADLGELSPASVLHVILSDGTVERR